ncbi:DNA alkylation repair protein, partial [Patescibacteria group bacterium]|nr:DNA alkylation repair protein [Patescibacteria group bacterium]
SKHFKNNYGGNSDPSLHINSQTLLLIVKDFVNKHKNLMFDEFLELLDLLYEGKYDDEKQVGGKLLQYYPVHKRNIELIRLDVWLNHLNGWSQVDSLCQSVFSVEDMTENWDKWQKILVSFSKDKNINKRRASLVLLTAPVRQSTNTEFSELAFMLIDRLKNEKGILITKAISWLLRDMVKNHKNEVATYLERTQNELPKIAFRETKRKLETGRK